jgi:starvation-inducible DNA-binding protein
MSKLHFTVPGISQDSAEAVVALLDRRLVGLIDLQLTLKHIHWNVVGPHFIAVHEMLDPQADAVREMVDEIAERIATLGGTPNGLPGYLVASRSWDDYSLGKGNAMAHLAALDLVYSGVITDHRAAQERAGDLDPVTEDMLIAQIAELEKAQWFVRAHLETPDGRLVTSAPTEIGAAEQAVAALT